MELIMRNLFYSFCVLFIFQTTTYANPLCDKLKQINEANESLAYLPKTEASYSLPLVTQSKENYRTIYQELLYRAQSRTLKKFVLSLKACPNSDLVLQSISLNDLEQLLGSQELTTLQQALEYDPLITTENLNFVGGIAMALGGVGVVILSVSGGQIVVLPLLIAGATGAATITGTVLSHTPGAIREGWVRFTQIEARKQADLLANQMAWAQIEKVLGSKYK